MKNLSIWRGTAQQTDLPALEGRVTADVAIVGGGITGLTLAMLLADAGKSVAVLEAHGIGEGSTGNSTGNLYDVLSEHIHTVGERWGSAVMEEVVDARREALELIARTAERLGGCGFVRCPLYLYATEAALVETVEKERQAAVQLGLPVRIHGQVPLPMPVASALVLENQAQIHPMRYLQGLAKQVVSDRCRIFERSAAVAVDAGGRIVHTARGSVAAREVVLATHTPKGVFLVQAEMLPHREYGVALPAGRTPLPDGIFWGLGADRHSLRRVQVDGNDYVVAVGEAHKTGHHPDGAGDPLGHLEGFVREHFDAPAAEFRWSAQSYCTADGLPYIGRSHASEVFIATGFATNGLVWGTLAATIVADQILGRENPWGETFRASRLAPMKAAKGVLSENLSVAKALLRDYARRPRTALSDIAPGTGALVEIDGEKLAAYRDEAGVLSVLSSACPHLKCLVHWNAAERTWDCPCHGSRFDTSGKVIEGPALQPLVSRAVRE